MKNFVLTLLIGIVSLMSAYTIHASTQKDKPVVVILLGAPGSGKGTQATQLSQYLKIPHISTGDLFRENLKNNTKLGEQAKGYMEAGKLVPDSLVLDMLYDRVAKADCANGYLLDGCPRTIEQAKALQKYFDDKYDLIVLNLSVTDSEVVKRISGRRVCMKCKAVYHIDSMPPKQPGICDNDGEALIQRKDDQKEVVLERLRVYHEQTKPLEDFYKKLGLFQEVDGSKPQEQVFNELIACINRAKVRSMK